MKKPVTMDVALMVPMPEPVARMVQGIGKLADMGPDTVMMIALAVFLDDLMPEGDTGSVEEARERIADALRTKNAEIRARMISKGYDV